MRHTRSPPANPPRRACDPACLSYSQFFAGDSSADLRHRIATPSSDHGKRLAWLPCLRHDKCCPHSVRL